MDIYCEELDGYYDVIIAQHCDHIMNNLWVHFGMNSMNLLEIFLCN